MTKTAKKWIMNIVRLAVCAIALGWVLKNVTYYDYATLEDGIAQRVEVGDGHITFLDASGSPEKTVPCDPVNCADDERITLGLRTTWKTADTGSLLLCFLIFAPVTLFQAWRFQLMLRAQEIPVTFWESAKLSYAGNFLNFVTALGSTGGDVFKMYYASLHTERKTEAVMAVVLDRIIGLFGLVLLVGCVLLVRRGDSKMDVLAYGIGFILLLGGLGCVFLFSETVRALVRPQHLLAKLPFAAQLQRAEAATRRLAGHKKLIALSVVATVALQAIAMTALIFGAIALDMRSDAAAIWDYYAYLASGMVVAAIPVSFMGLGTMEAFYKHAFLDTHGTLSAILCLAMLVRFVSLFWALPGVVVTLTGAYRPSISEEEVQFDSDPVPAQESPMKVEPSVSPEIHLKPKPAPAPAR